MAFGAVDAGLQPRVAFFRMRNSLPPGNQVVALSYANRTGDAVFLFHSYDQARGHVLDHAKLALDAGGEEFILSLTVL
jgi:hypothetical protein